MALPCPFPFPFPPSRPNETRPTANWPANNSFVVMNAKMKTKTNAKTNTNTTTNANANTNTKANTRKRNVRRSGHKVVAAAVATALEVAATKCCNRSSQWATSKPRQQPSETLTVLALLAISIWPRASGLLDTQTTELSPQSQKLCESRTRGSAELIAGRAA